MMDQTGLGKVIFINGPSFSGKTYFAEKLLKYLLPFDLCVSVVNFERVYQKDKDYNSLKESFINIIESKRKNYNVILAESTIINYGAENFVVQLMPELDVHNNRFNKYKSIYGDFDSFRRIYYPTINEARKNYLKVYRNNCNNGITIENNDIDCYLEKIKQYVFNS